MGENNRKLFQMDAVLSFFDIFYKAKQMSSEIF